MLKTVIIEDERIIAEEFKKLLLDTAPDTEVVASIATVKESIDYLSTHPSPDLIFSDVQLPDGLSFEIFNKVSVKSPVVFVTGYDQFVLNAFEHNGIDYLLKPVDERDLTRTLTKYRTLENHFALHSSFLQLFRPKIRTRLLVRKGIENIPLKMEDIVVIYTENKLVYVIDKDGKKYIAEQHLADLEEELDDSIFFRANRQYIINISYVKSYKAYEKVKLQVDLVFPDLTRQIIVSQEMAPHFRKWINEL